MLRGARPPHASARRTCACADCRARSSPSGRWRSQYWTSAAGRARSCESVWAREPALRAQVAPEPRDPLERRRESCAAAGQEPRQSAQAPAHPQSGRPCAPGTRCSCRDESDPDRCCPARAVRRRPSRPAAPGPPNRCRWHRRQTGIRAANRAPGRSAACRSRTASRRTSGSDHRRARGARSAAALHPAWSPIEHQHGVERIEVLAQARLDLLDRASRVAGAQQPAREPMQLLRDRIVGRAPPARTPPASLPARHACSRSTSIWRSTSEMVEPPRACGRRKRASSG